eukprot:GHVT01062399.1.p1 GENE.GHVT01062399.1~~GHVT01062399.1.p1  ORF type:complete len:557 (+),score=46.57 GHVT01062399.1:1468-3138(+)
MCWRVPKSTKSDLNKIQIEAELTNMRAAFFHLVKYWYRDKEDLEKSLPFKDFFVTTSRDSAGKAEFTLGHSSWPEVESGDSKLNLLSLKAEDIRLLKDGNIPERLEYTKTMIQEFTEYPVSRNFEKKCFSFDFDGKRQEIGIVKRQKKADIEDEFVPRSSLEEVLMKLTKKARWRKTVQYSFEPYLDSRVIATLPNNKKLFLPPELFYYWDNYQMGSQKAIPVLRSCVALEKVKAENNSLCGISVQPPSKRIADANYLNKFKEISDAYFDAKYDEFSEHKIEIPANIIEKTINGDVAELTEILNQSLVGKPVAGELKDKLIASDSENEYNVVRHPGCDSLWITRSSYNKDGKIDRTSLCFRESQLIKCLETGLKGKEAVTELFAKYKPPTRSIWIDLSSNGSFAVQDAFSEAIIQSFMGLDDSNKNLEMKGMKVLVNHLKTMKANGEAILYTDPKHVNYCPGSIAVDTLALWQTLTGDDQITALRKCGYGHNRFNKLMRTVHGDEQACQIARDMKLGEFLNHWNTIRDLTFYRNHKTFSTKRKMYRLNRKKLCLDR